MFLSSRFGGLNRLLAAYPRQFWILIGASFIDQVGGALVFPFFSLYITFKFGVGMTEVGIVFTLFAIFSVLGSTVGGALSDRIGRKKMIIFGLVASAVSTLAMGLATDVRVLYGLAVFVGIFANAGGPAQQAMVADLLPTEQRAEGFGILRVSANLAVAMGPAIGGLLVARSYLLIFVVDAIASLITAILLLIYIQETRPPSAEEKEEESWWQTFTGYRVAFTDQIFMVFLLASTIATIVYMQMNTTLAVYLRDVHDLPAQAYGLLISLNAGMVVIMQYWIARRVRPYPPLIMMAAGALLYAIGFGLYGFVTGVILFVTAMVIITIGEMIVVPVSQSLVALFSPEDMRGRYMAVYGFSWSLPTAIGPLAAGVVMDNYDPRWVWYGAMGLGVLSAAVFYGLYRRTRAQPSPIDQDP